MKTAKVWRMGMSEMQVLSGSRHRPPLKKPLWIMVLVLFVCLFLICAYIYPTSSDSACYVFSSKGCKVFVDWLPPPEREYTDEEIASRAVIHDILNAPHVLPKNPKIAFMFLTPGSLPFERLWDRFFQVWMSHMRLSPVFSFSCFLSIRVLLLHVLYVNNSFIPKS